MKTYSTSLVMGDRIILHFPRKDVHALICPPVNIVTFHGKEDFADVIQDLGMGRVSQMIQVGPK